MIWNATSFVGSKEIHFVSPIFIRLSSILVWECYECFCTHFPFEKVHACEFGEDKIKPQILKQKRDNYWYRILSDLDQYAKNANLNPKMLEIMFSKPKKKKKKLILEFFVITFSLILFFSIMWFEFTHEFCICFQLGMNMNTKQKTWKKREKRREKLQTYQENKRTTMKK